MLLQKDRVEMPVLRLGSALDGGVEGVGGDIGGVAGT